MLTSRSLVICTARPRSGPVIRPPSVVRPNFVRGSVSITAMRRPRTLVASANSRSISGLKGSVRSWVSGAETPWMEKTAWMTPR